jgi:hypothetical protein
MTAWGGCCRCSVAPRVTSLTGLSDNDNHQFTRSVNANHPFSGVKLTSGVLRYYYPAGKSLRSGRIKAAIPIEAGAVGAKPN